MELLQHGMAGPQAVHYFLQHMQQVPVLKSNTFWLLGDRNPLLVFLMLPGSTCSKYSSATQLLLQDGRTPLSWASEEGHLGVVVQLLSMGAAVDAASKVLPNPHPG
jgi:ankyrin repeat protein